MKTLAKSLGIGIFGLSLVGCGLVEEQEIIHERATVKKKEYVSGQDNLPLGVAMGNIALGVAMSTSEKYNITFIGNGIKTTVDNKPIFDRFNTNDVADLTFRNTYLVKYVDTNYDGKLELVNKEFFGREFLDAQPAGDKK